MSAFHCVGQQYPPSYTTKIPASQIQNFIVQSECQSESNAALNEDSRGAESSDYSQVHGRKMLRRVANRRSAQQSRARKKALMGDLKIENARLQKLADILDSQPELTFCIDLTGNIKFISETALNCMKSTLQDDSDDEPNHINQILTLESVETVLESVAEVRSNSARHTLNNRDIDHDGCISSVQSVCYHDANGFQVAGYVRCSRLIKRAPYDDSEILTIADAGPANKRVRASTPPNTSCNTTVDQLCNFSSTINQQNASMRQGHCISEVMPEIKPCRDKHHHHEEEFVCVIRPADASFPYVKGNRLFSSLLSTASMVAHDLELRSSGYSNQADPLAAGWSKEDYLAAGRLGGMRTHHSYHASQQMCSGSSSGTKNSNSTSSETNSEDNGEQDESPL